MSTMMSSGAQTRHYRKAIQAGFTLSTLGMGINQRGQVTEINAVLVHEITFSLP